MALKPSSSGKALQAMNNGRPRHRARLLAATAAVATVLLWAWSQQNLSLGWAGTVSSITAGSGGSSSSGSSTLLAPVEGARTLQFDVCNGFTNQRIALMSGLVLAAETNRSVVLPDWLLRGYMPDAKEFVTAGDDNAVPFRAWFEEDVFAEALASHGLEVVAGKAPQPWNVSINNFDSQSKVNAVIAFLRKKRARQHIKWVGYCKRLTGRINCPAFRLPGALMKRHEAMLRAAAEALHPSKQYRTLIEARRQEMAAKTGSDAYNLLHLRVEKDWLALCEWWQNPEEGRDNCMNNTATVGRQLKRRSFEQEVPLLVVTSFPDAVPEALAGVLKNIKKHKYRAVLGKELTVDAQLEREESALVDYYLALQADKFMGNSVSTFTAFVILERQWLGRPAFHYNGGNIPLEIFLPFYKD